MERGHSRLPIFTLWAVTLLLTSVRAAVLAPWSQCGGTTGACPAGGCADAEWPGSTCPDGYVCARMSDALWQCYDRSWLPEGYQNPAPSVKVLGLLDQCGGTTGACPAGGCADAEWPGSTCPDGAICARLSDAEWKCYDKSWLPEGYQNPAPAPGAKVSRADYIQTRLSLPPPPTVVPAAIPPPPPVITITHPVYNPNWQPPNQPSYIPPHGDAPFQNGKYPLISDCGVDYPMTLPPAPQIYPPGYNPMDVQPVPRPQPPQIYPPGYKPMDGKPAPRPQPPQIYLPGYKPNVQPVPWPQPPQMYPPGYKPMQPDLPRSPFISRNPYLNPLAAAYEQKLAEMRRRYWEDQRELDQLLQQIRTIAASPTMSP